MLRMMTLLALALTLAACAPGQPSTPQLPPPVNDTTTQPTPNPNQPVDSDATPPTERPFYAPQPGDDKLERGKAFLDTHEVLTLESFPPQYLLKLTGSLPTPCHQLRVTTSAPNEKGQILVEVYSVVDPQKICAQVLQEFMVNVPLGSLPSGTYSLLLNGESIAEITP